MKTGHQRIAIDLIEMNTGQIAGLPSNPRQWTKAQLDNLKASIEETPELCGQLIHNSSRPGQIVLDLFGGSGSTMMACEQLGRKNYTMEFDPHYCDVIIARWEKFTGMKAEKIE